MLDIKIEDLERQDMEVQGSEGGALPGEKPSERNEEDDDPFDDRKRQDRVLEGL